jgi:hypothetical protein
LSPKWLAEHTWSGEVGVAQRMRYGLLLSAVVVTVMVQGTIEPGGVQQVLVSGLLGLSLVLAFRIAHLSPLLVLGAMGIAFVGVALNVVRALIGVVGDGEARLMNALLVACAPPAVALGVVRMLRRTREVRVEAVMGVLTFYMLIGLLFAFIYGAIDRLGGDPFFANGATATVSHCQYFSFITLATVGYGDYVARTNVGHTLSVFEALIGQIYLVTVVSLIVGNLGRRGQA